MRWGWTRDGRAIGLQLLAGEIGTLDGPRRELAGGGTPLRLVAGEPFQVHVPEAADLGITYRLEPYLEPQFLDTGGSERGTGTQDEVGDWRCGVQARQLR